MRPFPGAVKDAQDLNLLAYDSIGNQIAGFWQHKFARPRDTAHPAQLGIGLEAGQRLINSSYYQGCSFPVVPSDVICFLL